MAQPEYEDDDELSPQLREQIMKEGVLAEQLLRHPAFVEIAEDLRKQYIAMFVTTSGDEKQKREDAYWAIRSLDSIVAVLQSRVQRANALVEIMEEEAAEQESRKTK